LKFNKNVKSYLFIIPLLSLAFAFGCHKKETKVIPLKSRQNQIAYELNKPLLPLAIGNQWEYSAYKTIQTPKVTNTYKNIYLFQVTQLTQLASGDQQATIDVTSNGKLVERKIWISSKNGIYQAAAGEKSIPYSPPMLMVPLPLQDHQHFNWKGTGPMELGTSVASTLTGKFLGIEGFETDTGRFKGVTIEMRQEWTENNQPASTLSQTWWIPGIGLGRLIEVTALLHERIEIIMRLKSYKIHSTNDLSLK